VDASGALTGDAGRGRMVYGKLGCAGCHTTAEGGGYLGPDLGKIGSRRSVAHLRESVVTPEASLSGGYVFAEITLGDGRKVSGQKLFEDTFTLNVRDMAGNNHSIEKAQAREIVLNQKKSPMPGYKDKLSGAELDDLVAFLASLKERP
jgi:putative heme-binding domain-containing protein